MPESFSVNLAQIMRRRGLSVSDVHRLSGVAYNTIRRYMEGSTESINLEKLSAVAEAVDVDLADLFKPKAEKPHLRNHTELAHIGRWVQRVCRYMFHPDGAQHIRPYVHEDLFSTSPNYRFLTFEQRDQHHLVEIREGEETYWGMSFESMMHANGRHRAGMEMVYMYPRSIAQLAYNEILVNQSLVTYTPQQELVTCQAITHWRFAKPLVVRNDNPINCYWWYMPEESYHYTSTSQEKNP